MSATGAAPARSRPSEDARASFEPFAYQSPDILPKAAGFEPWLSLLDRAADVAAVVAGVFAASAIYEALHLGRQLHYQFHTLASAAVFVALLVVCMMDLDGGYQRGYSLLRIRETERILRAAVKGFLFVFSITFLMGHLFSRWLLVLAVLIVPAFLIVEKRIFRQCVRWLHSKGRGMENAVIYGAGLTGRKLFSALVRSPNLGFNPVAVVDDNSELTGEVIFEHYYRRERSVSIIRGPVTKRQIIDHEARQVIVAIPSLSEERFNEVLREAAAAGARVAFVPKLSFLPRATHNCAEIDGLLISELGSASNSAAYEATKRLFDILASIVLIVLTFPLWIVIALLVWLDSTGPILFSQNRIGRQGKPFRLFKVRTMFRDAPRYALHPREARDPRITRMGRFLRRTSLDELPQLINVLRGEMSLVGPRPEMPFIVERYDAHQRMRLAVIPGITGIWQLSADRSFLIHENMIYDLYYIRHKNFFMDLAILLHTAAFAMKGI